MRNIENIEKKISPESKEKGKNVLINLEFLRHGEPGKRGLSKRGQTESAEYGRTVETEVDMVKGYASSISRAAQTRDIAIKQLEKEAAKLGTSRDDLILSYESVGTPPHFSWPNFRKKHLPTNF